MELAIASFMTTIGFSFAELLKMLVLVGFNFIFIGVIIWRVRKPLKAFYDKLMVTMDSLPKMEKSISDLNSTMQKNFEQTDNRLRIGDEKFMEQSREINRALRQLTAFAEHIRFLYTKLQLPEPKIGEDEEKTH